MTTPGKTRSGFALKAVLGLLALASAVGGVVWFGGRSAEPTYTTFMVKRGPLDIKVVAGGEIKEWTPEHKRKAYADAFASAGAFVFTIGLAEVWQDRETGGVERFAAGMAKALAR